MIIVFYCGVLMCGVDVVNGCLVSLIILSVCIVCWVFVGRIVVVVVGFWWVNLVCS